MFSSWYYKQAPIFLQNFFVSTRGFIRKLLRENWIMWKIFNSIDKLQWMDEHEIKKYQLKQIQKLLQFAENYIPYYKKLFKDIDFNYRDFKKLSDIKNLPFLTKDIVRKNQNLFVPSFPKRIFVISGHTSGTTGTPLKIYQDFMSIIKERAFYWRQLKWAGFNKGEKKVWIRGDMIVPNTQQSPPYWRYNKAENQLMMSSCHISDKTLPLYLQAIKNFAPSLIEAYPSSLFAIASFMKNNGYRPIKVKAVITSSETLFPEQKQIIEEMFSCKVFNWYGNVEHVAAIGTCEYGNYHIIEDYGYTELIDYGNGFKEIVSTGFNNKFMPLIRYKTGDLVKSSVFKDKCFCDRCFRVVTSIVGRMDDYILLPNGRKIIGMLDFIFKENLPILEGQIYQFKDYSIEIRVVPDKGFTLQHEAKLLNSAKEMIGDEVPIKVNHVEKIPRTKNNKLKVIVSEVVS